MKAAITLVWPCSESHKVFLWVCGVSCLPLALARWMQPVPDMLVSVSAIWPPSPPVIPERVSDNGRRSGKWTSGEPVQCYALLYTMFSSGLETRPLAHQPTGHMDGNLHSALRSAGA